MRLRWPAPRVRIFSFSALLVGTMIAAFAMGRCSAPSTASSTGETVATPEVYTCAMHPDIHSDNPGICPICAMDLVPARSIEHESLAPTTLALSPRAAALARLRTAPVLRVDGATGTRRLAGRVRPDESRQRTVTSWIEGRIDRLLVRTTGTRVNRGRALARLYSPEVFTAHQDLLSAARQVTRLGQASAAVRQAATAALEASRDRLRLLGIEDAELHAMEQASAPTRSVSIRSPFSGTVLERLVSEGEYVRAGTPLFRIADLGAVWVELDVFERDLALLTPGAEVSLQLAAVPGLTLEGEVSFVDPVVDPATGATHVRVEVSNQDGTLRPGMVVEGTLTLERSEGEPQPLVIPASAPLFTGRRAVVYVDVSEPSRPLYEARSVVLGPRVGERFEVIAGLAEGEHVVTHGAFALDAELQLRGGEGMMAQADDGDRLEPSLELRGHLAKLVMQAVHLAAHLATDDATAAARSAAAVAEAIDAVDVSDSPAAVAATWRSAALQDQAPVLRAAQDLASLRRALPALQHSLESLLGSFGNPTDETLFVAECPMAFGPGESARWLQLGDAVTNAYRGQQMLSCGSIEARVAPGAVLSGDITEPPEPAP